MTFYHDGESWRDTEKDDERQEALAELLDTLLTPVMGSLELRRVGTLAWQDERAACVVRLRIERQGRMVKSL